MHGPEPYQKLRERLFRQYKLEEQVLSFGKKKLKLFAVADTDALMDALLAKGEDHPDVRDERLPYWAELWPSALALTKRIMEMPEWDSSRSVLEIGCGLGLPGIAAAMRGSKVVLTDYLPEPLDLARLNWLENFGTEPDCRLMDWRKPLPELASDILLASDVAYEKRAFTPLLHAFRYLVKPGGYILLSEPNRTFSRPFIASLPEMGYEVESFTYPLTWKGMVYKVSVRKIRGAII